MPERTYEALGDCYIAYETETPKEYTARTGEYLGGAEPPLVGYVTLFYRGAPMAVFSDRETARLHMKGIATVEKAYPLPA